MPRQRIPVLAVRCPQAKQAEAALGLRPLACTTSGHCIVNEPVTLPPEVSVIVNEPANDGLIRVSVSDALEADIGIG